MNPHHLLRFRISSVIWQLFFGISFGALHMVCGRIGNLLNVEASDIYNYSPGKGTTVVLIVILTFPDVRVINLKRLGKKIICGIENIISHFC